MSFLLDTHTYLWWLYDDPRLSAKVRETVEDPYNRIYVSAASGWEISTKYRLGKLPVAAQLCQDISGWVAKAGFAELAISTPHAQRAGAWTQKHRDPFDRMLAAQSAIEDLQLISRDSELEHFGIRLFW